MKEEFKLLIVPNNLKNFSLVVLVTWRCTKQEPQTNTWDGFEIFFHKERKHRMLYVKFCESEDQIWYLSKANKYLM